jgi:superfamily I DNA/RNA helicase
LIPLQTKRARSVNTEEERRLLYVGMTRAQHQLILTAAAKRSRHGQTYENGFCPFLSSVSAELFEAMQGRRRPRRARQLALL